jgi:multiple antibiotic resistance protein
LEAWLASLIDAAKVLFVTVSALFPIVDPLTGSPIFLLLTRGYAPEMRRALARRVAFDSFLLMIGSYYVGAHVLNFFGVSLPVVQVGGGLVVVVIGWGMLMPKDDSGDATRRTIQPQDGLSHAFYPLTLPLTVGPGSISVAITLGANATHRYGLHIVVILAALVAMTLIAFSIYVCYGFADKLARVVGDTGMSVILRLSSFLLVCIGVQIIWNGISALISSVPLQIK